MKFVDVKVTLEFEKVFALARSNCLEMRRFLGNIPELLDSTTTKQTKSNASVGKIVHYYEARTAGRSNFRVVGLRSKSIIGVSEHFVELAFCSVSFFSELGKLVILKVFLIRVGG